MLGLPKTTELSRPLSKKAIFERFKINLADRQQFDNDIKRLTIVGEVSAATTIISLGEKVKSFYVVLVTLRGAECANRNLLLLSKLIRQRMLFVLEHDGMARLAVCRFGKVLESDEKPLHECHIALKGLNLDSVWEGIIIQVGSLTLAEGKTLDEQIAANAERSKTLRHIDQLEKQAWSEKQPRRKWKLAEEANKLREKMGANT